MHGAAIVGLVAWGVEGRADGCTMFPTDNYEAVPMGQDQVPPRAPVVESVDVYRGRGSERLCGGLVSSSTCGEFGGIHLEFEPGVDDVSPPERMGYRLVLVAGELPEGLGLFGEPVPGPSVSLHWTDGATWDQDPFWFELAVTALDEDWNESAPTRVAIEDDGIGEPPVPDCPPEGCDSAGGPAGWTALAPLLLTRRRARPLPPRSPGPPPR